MKTIGKVMIAALLAVLLVAWASPSEAWSGHGRPGYGRRLDHNGHYRSVWRGPRFYWRGSVVLGPWYPNYAPPPLIVQDQPRVYVEPEPQPADYWYYCQDPQGYYPYVKKCPDGWMKVVPEVSPPNQ